MATCEHCGTALTVHNGGWLPTDDPAGARYHYFHECIEALKGQIHALRQREEAVRLVARAAVAWKWAKIGADKDWDADEHDTKLTDVVTDYEMTNEPALVTTPRETD
jgi:hypothetical protein